MLAHFMLLHGLFISNKNFTVLVTMKTVTKNSSIAILAECFVRFLNEIAYEQLLWEFTSVVIYIRCNFILHRL